jgi:hypothetical protein
MKKKTQNEVDDIFRNGNCELLDLYKNTTTKMKFKCSCGSISEITINSFMAGCRCANCRNERLKKTNIERYGVEFTSQRTDIKEDLLSGFKKHSQEKKLTIDNVCNTFE